jgi:hypothetical protein
VWTCVAQEVYDAFKLVAKHVWVLKFMANAMDMPLCLTWCELGHSLNLDTMELAISNYNKDNYSDQVAFMVFLGFKNGLEMLKMMVYPMVKTSTSKNFF